MLEVETGDKEEFLLYTRQILSLFSSINTSDFISTDGLWNIPVWNRNVANYHWI